LPSAPRSNFTTPEEPTTCPHDPVLSDETAGGKGFVGGRRVDRVTYAFEKPGSYVLPAVKLAWYDPSTQKNAVAEAPQIDVVIAASPAFRPAIAPPSLSAEPPPAARFEWLRYVSWTAGAVVVFAVVGWLVAWLRPRLAAWREARRLQREHSEAAFFGRFEQACRSGDRLAAYASLDAWSRRAGVAPIGAWLIRIGNPAARQEYEHFEQAMFRAGPQSGPWDARTLLAGMSKARKAWLARRPAQAAARSTLPELNP